MLARPRRRDLTSLPSKTMPASMVSTISYSWRALRFSATRPVEIVVGALGDFAAMTRPPLPIYGVMTKALQNARHLQPAFWMHQQSHLMAPAKSGHKGLKGWPHI